MQVLQLTHTQKWCLLALPQLNHLFYSIVFSCEYRLLICRIKCIYIRLVLFDLCPSIKQNEKDEHKQMYMRQITTHLLQASINSLCYTGAQVSREMKKEPKKHRTQRDREREKAKVNTIFTGGERTHDMRAQQSTKDPLLKLYPQMRRVTRTQRERENKKKIQSDCRISCPSGYVAGESYT